MASPGSGPDEVTRALEQLRRGDSSGFDVVLEVVFAELRAVAARHMSGERSDHTLQPTALLNEAYLRIVQDAHVGWENRAHFFAAAARAMRQVLVDHARRRGAEKRGGDMQRVTLHEDLAPDIRQSEFELLDLHNAIDRLAEKDEQLGRLIELRFFGGLTLDETADVLQVSRRKVAKDWAFARVWLARELSDDE
jgi:RNA polymerase sigma factor (TIGR02999 family)